MLSLLLSTACAQDSQSFLTGAELKQIFAGSKFRYSGYLQGNQFSGEMQFNENGNLFVSTDSRIPEGGTWRIQGDVLCTKLVALRGGTEKCFSVSATGDNRYETSHGFQLQGL
jgi:hypothetical protein